MTVRSWGAEEQVNGGWTGFQGEPDLAALPDGGFVVAWMDRADPSLAVMRFQRFDSAGEPAGPEGQVPVAGAWSSLTLTVLADGGWLIGAELAGVGEERGIQAFRFDAQGGYLGWQVLDPFGAPATGAPVTAAFGTGFVAVQERNGDLIGTWYDATGTVVGGEVTVNGTTVGAQRHADVTALAQGGFAAVWTDMNIGRAQFRIFDQNGYPVTPEDVPANSSSLGGNAGHASIAALAGGGLVIAWETSTPLFPGAAPDIRARIFTATGAPVGMDFVVNANTLGPQTTPEVAGLRSGGFVVVWADLASGPGLRGQVFDAWGLRDGGEFTINTGPLPSDIVAGDISLAELSDGRIAVAWRGLDDGGSGILRQIIDPRDGVVEGTAADDGLWGNDAWGDEISGYGGQDRLSGLRGDDVLFGGDGGDVLRGGRGDDLLYGNRGDDTLLGGAGADDLYGGAGFDTASFAGLFAVSLALDGSLEGDGSARGDLFRGIERVEGSEAGDLLRGASAFETLVGAGRDDRLEGRLLLRGGGPADPGQRPAPHRGQHRH